MRLSEYASTRKTRGSYKMPRSVQQSIPIDRIYADGVWQSENVFSLMWQISDINYAMQSDAAKQNILTQLGTVYAGIPADCWMQVCIVSQRMQMMTRLQRFADVGSLTSTCFLSIGVHAEHFTQQNK